MLEALSIVDFAIIDRLDLVLDRGLTVITGETGAGKSVLIHALGLVLGERARTEVVRTGAEAAEVQAQFDLREAPDVRARLEEAGLDADDHLIVRRIVARNGRHRVYLNGSLASLSTLASVAEGLVDISGQHAHHSLLRADVHLDLLDRVGGLDREPVEAAWRAVAALDARIDEVDARRRQRAEREDFLKFQLRELLDARLDDPDEEEALEQEVLRLRNVEKLRQAAGKAEDELQQANDSVVDRLGRAVRAVERLVDVDADLKPMLEELRQAQVIVEDAAHSLGVYRRDLHAEPQRLEQIEARLAVFTRLRRKHGATLAEVIARKQALEAELADIEGAEDTLDRLRLERLAAGKALVAVAEALSAARRRAARAFTAAVEGELADLAMGGARLAMRFGDVAGGVVVDGRNIGQRGQDRVELLLSANPGEEPAALGRIASGGELSRLMLAVKRVIAAADPVGTYIFDEVDTGVGGATAEAIGRKLKAVSQARQAICITHLPQIAALGDHHLHVEKHVEGDRTVSRVVTLDATGRVEELARMLGGARITETTRANAAELLRLGALSPGS
ncbi:MAG: DNA repair protein RecN [bacterium]